MSASCPVEVVSTINSSIAGQTFSGTSTYGDYTLQYTYSFNSSNEYTLLKANTYLSTTAYTEYCGNYDIQNNYITLSQTMKRSRTSPTDTTQAWTAEPLTLRVPVLLEGNTLHLPTDQYAIFMLFGHGTSGIVGTWDAAFYSSDHYGSPWYQKYICTADNSGSILIMGYSGSSTAYSDAPTSFNATYTINPDSTIAITIPGATMKFLILNSCLLASENSGGGVAVFTKQ
jgi:hypothetical protein